MAFASDILHGQIAAIAFPTELCERMPAVFAPTRETMQESFAANPNAVFLGPYAENDPDVEEVITRRVVPVPHAYVPLVLFRSLSPREAWLQLGEAIIQDQRQEACDVLLDFLRAASVFAQQPAAAAGAQPAAILPVTRCPADMQPLMLDPELTEHIRRTYLRYLPALGVPDVNQAITQQLLQSAMVLRDAMEGAAVAQQAQAAADPAPAKSFTEVYPGMAASLRKLCGAGDEDEALPLFWRTFAAATGKKGQCWPLLEALLNQRALEPDSTQIQQVLTNGFYDCIQNFRIGSTDIDNLTLGLTPFLICPAGYHKASAQRSDGFLFSSVSGDGYVTSLDEVKSLLTPAINIPSNFYQLVDFIGAYSVMLDVLTGYNEPLAVAVRHHFFFWRATVSEVVTAISREHRVAQTDFLVGVLRFIQLQVQQNINDRMNVNKPAVPPPNFQLIEDSVRNRTFRMLPSLPAQYYADIQAANEADAARAAGLPVPTGNTQSTTQTARTSENVTATNAEANSDWQKRFLESGISIGNLKSAGFRNLPSSTDKQCKLCLSFHLRGTCFKNCRNKATHRKLQPSEAKDMEAFLVKHLVKETPL